MSLSITGIRWRQLALLFRSKEEMMDHLGPASGEFDPGMKAMNVV